MKRFLFYVVGVAGVLGALLGLVGGLMDWSNGVAFAALVVAGTITAVLALRESLFEGFRRSDGKRRHGRHA